MITVKQLYDSGRGSIVDYLLEAVSDGVGDVRAQSGATRYYAESGTPPGRWLGSGLAGLGAGRVRMSEGEQVDADQLRALIADGLDPLTGEPLGRSFVRAVPRAERVRERIAALPRALSATERLEAIDTIRADESSRRRVARSVHGFDFTFAPPKSVSVLWALGDAGLREQIEAAHHEAIATVLTLMERDVARTRTGSQGVVHETTRGLIAAAFDHWDSREHDPHLHTHVVVANRVEGADGKWRTLDSRGTLFPSTVAMSETYDNLLMDSLAERIGVQWQPARRPRGSRAATWQIDGLPPELLEHFSQRRRAILAARGDVDQRATREQDAKAWADTRTTKSHHSLADLTSSWTQRAQAVMRSSRRLRDVLERATGRDVATRPNQTGRRPVPVQAADVFGEHLHDLAVRVVDELSSARAHWSDWNIRAEVERATRHLRTTSPLERDELRARLTRAVEALSVRLDTAPLAHTPGAFTRADGTSKFRAEYSASWTTAAMLAAEDRLHSAADTIDAPAVDPGRATDVLTSWRGEGGRQLGEDQAQAAYDVVVSGRGLDVLVGPAGAGKTTTLAALRMAWETTQGPGSVRGLAPSAAAADVLAGSLGVATENLDKWLYETTDPDSLAGRRKRREDARKLAHSQDPDFRRRGRQRLAELDDEEAAFRLRPGQLLVVDEASMAATLPLDAIVTQARAAGAKVLLVGDWAQLSSVGAGGAFGMLVRSRDHAPELTGVRRFREPWEAAATLGLRLGDTAVLDTYTRHGRLHDGEEQEILDAVYTAWSNDTERGLRSVMVAADNTTAAQLAARARTDRVAAGLVSHDGTALHDGTTAGTGDLVTTRRNDRHLAHNGTWVKNGDTFVVVTHNRDGSLLVRPAGRPRADRITLPADYVREHLELAYATTAHRAQGSTVDTAHTVVTDRLSRELLYVAMTRGAHANHAYVVTDDDGLERGTTDEETTPTEILEQVLRRSSAPLAAREQVAHVAEQQGSIAQLAAEYETIARAARADEIATRLAAAGVPSDVLHDVLEAPAYAGIVSVLHRATAYDMPVDIALPAIVSAAPLSHDDPAADLLARTTTWFTASRPERPATPRRLIAGLIPSDQPADPDERRALDERAQLIEQRARALLDVALIAAHPSWTDALGPLPDNPAARERWISHAITVAAYRDRYDVTGAEPAGGDPGTQWTRRDDHRRATAAVAAARVLASGTEPPQRAVVASPHRGPNTSRHGQTPDLA